MFYHWITIYIISNNFIVDQTTQTIGYSSVNGKKFIQIRLKFKVPWIQDILFMIKGFWIMIFLLFILPQEIKKRLVVDTYTRYKICDPFVFTEQLSLLLL